MQPLKDDDVAKFMHLIDGNKYEAIFVLAVFSGMRKSELLGLQWEDIDLNNGHIMVRRQYQQDRVNGGMTKIESTKNGKERLVVIPASVCDILRKHRAEQSKNRLSIGSDWQNDDNAVFTDARGKRTASWQLTREFKKIMHEMGKDGTRFHDLRHTYAINALTVGDSPKSVQEQLGHSTIKMTMDIYAEVSEEMRKGTQDRMEKLFQNISKNA